MNHKRELLCCLWVLDIQDPSVLYAVGCLQPMLRISLWCKVCCLFSVFGSLAGTTPNFESHRSFSKKIIRL